MTKKIDHFAFLERARMNPDVFPLEVRQTEFREVYKPFDQPMAAEQKPSIEKPAGIEAHGKMMWQ